MTADTAPSRMPRYALAAAFLAFALYSASLGGAFIVGDDFASVRDNPALSLPPAAFFNWAFSTFELSAWQPLTWISFRIDHALWGADPRGYHLTSALLHALNAFLVTLLLGRLIRAARQGRDDIASAEAGALIAGLMFASHPALAESVAWISGRKVLLSAVFWLGSALIYMKYTERRRPWLYLASIASFALALMSQPMAATLPLALLILDRYPLRRPWRRSLIEKIPYALLGIASAMVTYAAYKDTLSGMTPLGWGYRLLGAVRALGHYMAKTAAPVGLSAFYPQPMGGAAVNAAHVGAVVAVLAVSLAALLVRKKAPAVIAGWTFFVVTLMPVLGLIPTGLQAAADRYMYIAVLGPLGIVAAYGWRGRKSRMAAALLVAALCVLCLVQIRTWRTSATLWEHSRELYPNDAQPYAWLGLAAMADGRTVEALALLDQAVNIEIETVTNSPRLHWLYATRADALMTRGEYEKAAIDYSAAIRIKDSYDVYYIKRGKAYSAMGEWDRAISDLRRAVALRPDNAEAWGLLGAARLKRADYARAADAFTKAIALQPGGRAFHEGRAEAYIAMGRPDLAAEDRRQR